MLKSGPIEKLLNLFPALLAFLVPVFFLPFTTEFFEFNKLTLVAAGTAVMVLLWIGLFFYKKRVEVVKSSVDVSVFLAFGVLLLATIFSIDKTSSIFGSQGRWFPSLFAGTTLLLFYYVVATTVSSVSDIKKILNALVLGITISSIVAVLGYFGIKFGSQVYFQVPNFTLTGSTTVAALLASLATVLSLTMLVSNSELPTKLLALLTLFINFLAVVLIGSISSWAVLLVGGLALVYFTPQKSWIENKSILGLAGILVASLIVLLVVPVTRNFVINEDYPQELRLSVKESWIVASSVIRDFPILGTGPSTFSLDYTQYKPISTNNQEYWNVRFDKPHSEVFGVISAMGILGVVFILAFGIKAIRYSLNTKRMAESNPTVALASIGLLMMLIAMLFTYATVVSVFLIALFLALTTANNRLASNGEAELVTLSIASITGNKSSSLLGESGGGEIFHYIVSVPLLALVLVGGYFFYRQYAGEFFMRQAILAARENNGGLTYQMQQRAINANPARASYQNSYANTNLALASTIASNEQITDEDRATIQALISQAIRSARVSTEVLNPLSAAGWETRANIYRSLIGVADNASDWAIRSYNTAIQLDPTNPRLRLELGGIYYANEDFLSAANLFNQAASLKGDYANAHYNLAQALLQLQNYAQARSELEITQRLVAEGSEDYQRVAAELAALADLPTVAGATDQPSVEELEGVEEPTSEQEPLENVGEQETLENSGAESQTDEQSNESGIEEEQAQEENTQP